MDGIRSNIVTLKARSSVSMSPASQSRRMHFRALIAFTSPTSALIIWFQIKVFLI